MTNGPRRSPLVPALACAAGLLWLAATAGCQNGLGGKAGLPALSNPFKTAAKTAPKEDPAAASKAAASKVGPEFAEGLMRGRQLETANKLAEAREIYQNLIVKYPDRYEPYRRLGVVADRQKRYREAVALYSQAIALNPDPEIFNDLGYCYYLQGQLDKAESALLKAVSMKPANARFRNNLAMVYGHQGRFDEALEQFRRGGSEADAYYNMAYVLAARDDVPGAKRCLMLAQAADPMNAKARQALKSMEDAENGKHDDAPPEAVANRGGRWENYRDGQERQATLASAAPAQKVSYNAQESGEAATQAAAPAAPNGSSPRGDTQALLRRARSMMSERMADRGPTQR